MNTKRASVVEAWRLGGGGGALYLTDVDVDDCIAKKKKTKQRCCPQPGCSTGRQRYPLDKLLSSGQRSLFCQNISTWIAA